MVTPNSNSANPVNDNVMDPRETFYYYFNIENVKRANNQTRLSFSKYKSLIEEVKVVKSPKGRVKKKAKPRDYWLLKRYDISLIEGSEKLIVPLNNKNNIHGSILYYVHDEEIYDILREAHMSTGHGGRDRMLKQINEKYKNITQKDIMLFISLCKPCQQRRKQPKTDLDTKPIFYDLNARGQIDLIDYQSCQDNAFKFLMVYQDASTKFIMLKALKTKKVEEVAKHLVNIFAIFGTPSVLQSDNGQLDFVTDLIEHLKTIWPNHKIVYGQCRDGQSQIGSSERTNHDIQNMITAWLQGHNSKRWSESLDFVQFIKNSSFNAGLKTSPYEAMFGCKPQFGLASLNLSEELLSNISTEEELENAIKYLQGEDNDDDDNDDSVANNNTSSAEIDSASSEILTVSYDLGHDYDVKK